MSLQFITQPGPGYLASSITPITVGLGSLACTVAAGLAYSVGAAVLVTSAGGAQMYGSVTAYSGTTLTINVTFVVTGSGSHSDWTINLTGLSSFPGAWQAPTLLNSWTNSGGGLTASQYAVQNGVNELLLAGAITPGTTGAGFISIFNVPVGYRPAANRYAGAVGIASGVGEVTVFLQVTTAGNVQLFNTSLYTFTQIIIDSRIPLF